MELNRRSLLAALLAPLALTKKHSPHRSGECFFPDLFSLRTKIIEERQSMRIKEEGEKSMEKLYRSAY